jgi:hypothetical protein
MFPTRWVLSPPAQASIVFGSAHFPSRPATIRNVAHQAERRDEIVARES